MFAAHRMSIPEGSQQLAGGKRLLFGLVPIRAAVGQGTDAASLGENFRHSAY